MILQDAVTIATIDMWIPIISASGAILVSALAIIFNPVLSRALKKFEDSNKLSHKLITNRVTTIDNELTQLHEKFDSHNQFIQYYVADKETIKSLELVLRDALKYVGDGSPIGTYMELVGHITIDAIKEIQDIGIDRLTTEQLKAKLLYARARAFDLEACIINNEYVKEFQNYRLSEKTGERFITGIMIITNDTINQKTSRFRVICESYMQNLMRDMILTWTTYANKN